MINRVRFDVCTLVVSKEFKGTYVSTYTGRERIAFNILNVLGAYTIVDFAFACAKKNATKFANCNRHL